jgi:hypothetical protein
LHQEGAHAATTHAVYDRDDHDEKGVCFRRPQDTVFAASSVCSTVARAVKLVRSRRGAEFSWERSRFSWTARSGGDDDRKEHEREAGP